MMTMKLNRLLITFVACWFVSVAGVAKAQQRLPNLILMMGDDHGWEETGYNGHPYLQTPVLDEMAAKGLRMDRFHAAHPTCSPTRASSLTGRHPNRIGTFAPGWSLRPEEITIAHLLKQAGYRCGHFGKWHVGPVDAQSPTNPAAMGFDHFVSHDNFFEIDPPLSVSGGPPQIFPGESSAVLIEQATAFIDQAVADDVPFLVVIWFGSPHEPYCGLPDDLALYDSLVERYANRTARVTSLETGLTVSRPQGEVLRERYAEITAMDRAIGTLREHLQHQQLRDDTLLFYCGDNGTSADAAVFSPHRGHKGQFYNGGTLVPCVVEWPSRITEPTTSPLLSTTSDLLPTLSGISGIDVPDRPLDGINLLPLIEAGVAERPQPVAFWGFPVGRFQQLTLQPWIAPDLQQGTTPLVKQMQGKFTRRFTNWQHPPIEPVDYTGTRALIGPRFKLLIHETQPGEPRVELFDLIADPAEKDSVANQHPEVVEQMQRELREWQESVLKCLTGERHE